MLCLKVILLVGLLSVSFFINFWVVKEIPENKVMQRSRYYHLERGLIQHIFSCRFVNFPVSWYYFEYDGHLNWVWISLFPWLFSFYSFYFILLYYFACDGRTSLHHSFYLNLGFFILLYFCFVSFLCKLSNFICHVSLSDRQLLLFFDRMKGKHHTSMWSLILKRCKFKNSYWLKRKKKKSLKDSYYSHGCS